MTFQEVNIGVYSLINLSLSLVAMVAKLACFCCNGWMLMEESYFIWLKQLPLILRRLKQRLLGGLLLLFLETNLGTCPLIKLGLPLGCHGSIDVFADMDGCLCKNTDS